MDFTSLPPSIIDDLYEEAKLEVLTFDDFLNLPLNDLYLKENGNDPKTFAKYTADPNYTIDDTNDFVSLFEVIDGKKVYYNFLFPDGYYNHKSFTTKLKELLLEVSPYFDVDQYTITNSKSIPFTNGCVNPLTEIFKLLSCDNDNRVQLSS